MISEMEEDLRHLQRLLHATLQAFAGGALVSPLASLRGRTWAPCHPAWLARLHEIEQLCGRLSGTGSTAGDRRIRTFRDAAIVLARGYRLLRERVPAEPGVVAGAAPLQVLRRLDVPEGRATDSPAMYALQAYLRSHCADDLRAAFVHGSYSTGDANAYSDLDTLVVLRTSVVEDPERLLACALRLIPSNRYLLQCDLLQHHTHFVLTETDAFFPRILFRYSTELFCDTNLAVVRARDSAAECRRDLDSMCRRFLKPPAAAILMRAYSLKLHLSCFMILPALLSQVLGEACYKRDSFARVRDLYEPAEWQVMDQVSAIRQQWRQTSPGLWASIAALHPLVHALLIRRFGSWGVPAGVISQVTNPVFETRQRQFAEKTLRLARQAGHAEVAV
jgi:predicted nucleotidyltransferase